jgi:hypothetical protein
MTARFEDLSLANPDLVEHRRAVFAIDKSSAILISRIQSRSKKTKKLDPPEIAINEFRLEGASWEPWNGIVLAEAAALGVGDALVAMADGYTLPATLPLYAALTVEDEHWAELARAVIPDGNHAVGVFHYTEGRGKKAPRCVWLGRYKRAKGGWEVEGYVSHGEKTAFEIGRRIVAMKPLK